MLIKVKWINKVLLKNIKKACDKKVEIPHPQVDKEKWSININSFFSCLPMWIQLNSWSYSAFAQYYLKVSLNKGKGEGGHCRGCAEHTAQTRAHTEKKKNCILYRKKSVIYRTFRLVMWHSLIIKQDPEVHYLYLTLYQKFKANKRYICRHMSI